MKALDRDQPREFCGAGEHAQMDRPHAPDGYQRVEAVATNLSDALTRASLAPTREERKRGPIGFRPSRGSEIRHGSPAYVALSVAVATNAGIAHTLHVARTSAGDLKIRRSAR